MSKKRTWSDDYVKFGFTCVDKSDELPKAQCIICSLVLSNSSLRPSKLQPHFLKHGGEKAKGNDLESLKTKRARFDARGTLSSMSFCSVDKPTLFASYQAAQMIGECKKAHTIGEDLIKPLFVRMAETLMGKEARKKFEKVPMSNNVIRERINDLSEDILEQIISDLKKTPHKIALQLDETTDVASCSQLIAFVRYYKDDSIREDFLFCQNLETTTTARDVLQLVKDFFKIHDLSLTIIGCICTDGAPAMLGNKSGFCALMKREVPNIQVTHCFLHRHALATKTLPQDLREALDLSVNIINFIRGKALNSRLFKSLCESTGSDHSMLLFHSNVRWLSRGRALSRLFELRDEVEKFLKQRKSNLAEQLDSPEFMERLAYLSDIFSLMNELSVSLQGRGTHMLSAKEKLNAFLNKLSLWRRQVESRNLKNFPSLENIMKSGSTDTDHRTSAILSEVSTHLGMLSEAFDGYFAPGDLTVAHEWIINPFTFNMEYLTDDDNSQEDLIELRADRSLAMRYETVGLEEFWCRIASTYPRLAETALNSLIPFATTYLCEQGFSTLLVIKNKYRSRLNAEADMRVAISNTKSRIERLVEKRQEQPSH